MSIIQLKPSFKDYIWGGNQLVTDFHKAYEGSVLAESWELSCHPDGPSRIANGPYAGKTLQEYINIEGPSVLGHNCKRFDQFPILVKLIDAQENLSIQVHPNNIYALAHEHQYGKTEMWYIIKAREGAFIYYGFNRVVSKREMKERIQANTLVEVLQKVVVKKGDVFFIEPGTIHAIGSGILLAEIQQNSNVTYRVYDYGRVGVDGKLRELHISQALDVTNREPAKLYIAPNNHLAQCEYFVVDDVIINQEMDGKGKATQQEASSENIKENEYRGIVTIDSFTHVLVIEGEGTLRNGSERKSINKGDSLWLAAGSGKYVIKGQIEALITTIGEHM